MLRAANKNWPRKNIQIMRSFMNIKVPGSKSITNRALICAALAKGKSSLRGILKSDDTKWMIKALNSLGVKIKVNKDAAKVFGGEFKKTRAKIFCGNAGTVMRFLTAVLSAQNFETILTGDLRMQQRPIKDLVEALKQLGARIEYLGESGFPPIKIVKPMVGGKCELKGNISSQFLSALLLASPLAKKDTEIKIVGELVSKPYVDMTLSVMESFGIEVKRNGYKTFKIKSGQKYKVANFKIEGDGSSATYFWGISALMGEKINVKNVLKNSLQADYKILEITKKMQKNPDGSLQNIGKIDCKDFPDGAMTLAVLCAFTKGKNELVGLANLREKECDRLHAIAAELRRIGTKVTELKDGLIIFGDPEKLHGAEIETYNDHRMAMCFGMAQIAIPEIKIKNPNCVSKTYPTFWRDLEKVKSKIKSKNIVLTGMRGSGKTKIGKVLAQKLKRDFYDIDAEIEKFANMKILHIVAKKGWKYFRKLEFQMVKKISKLKNKVISTGGGTIISPANAKLLKKFGRIIYLDCQVATLRKRLIKSLNRPTLSGKNFLDELDAVYKKRIKKYLKAADCIIDVSKNSKNQIKDLNEKAHKIAHAAVRLFGLK